MRRCRLGKPHVYEIKIHKAGFGDLAQPATKRHSSEPKQQADNGSYRQTRWPRLTAKWSVGRLSNENFDAPIACPSGHSVVFAHWFMGSAAIDTDPAGSYTAVN